MDLRRTLRAIRKEPLFAVVAASTLGLGIGANTALYSVVQAVLLSRDAYPVARPEDVVVLGESAQGYREMGVAYPDFKDWQRMSRSFESLAGFREIEQNFTGADEPVRLPVTQVSSSYFSILGVSPIAGRRFSAEDDRAGAADVVMLNHTLWRNRFGSDPDVVGQSVTLDEKPYTIIGVLPENLEPSPEERAYVALEPWADDDDVRDRGNHMDLFALGRLAEGVSIENARSEMETIVRALEQEHPKTNSGIGFTLERLFDRRVREYRRTLWTLLGATGLVLLIAIVNVANLLLARAVGRKRATAIAAALGASRFRIVREGLMEGLVLALLGGALGAFLAFGSLQLLRGVLPADVPGIERVALDLPVLFYTFGISLAAGLLFGSTPAWLLSRSHPTESMRDGSRDTGQRNRFGRWLLVVELGLATVLVIGASLLIRTVYELTQVSPGFRPDHLLTLRLGIPHERYQGEARRAFVASGRRARCAARSAVGDATRPCVHRQRFHDRENPRARMAPRASITLLRDRPAQDGGPVARYRAPVRACRGRPEVAASGVERSTWGYFAGFAVGGRMLHCPRISPA
jgi:predicted permease